MNLRKQAKPSFATIVLLIKLETLRYRLPTFQLIYQTPYPTR